jgi:hypothetical protein
VLDWIKNNFPQFRDEFVVYQTDEGEFTTISETNIQLLFGDLDAPPKYEVLSAMPIAKQGWQPIFDQWKEKGLIS